VPRIEGLARDERLTRRMSWVCSRELLGVCAPWPVPQVRVWKTCRFFAAEINKLLYAAGFLDLDLETRLGDRIFHNTQWFTGPQAVER